MTDPGVDTHLALARDARGVQVMAYVASAPARPLRWKLETVTRSSGGTSNVSQSGTVQGGSDRPVSVSTVSLQSKGTVILTVYDGTREVAREEATIEDTPSFGQVPDR